MKKFIKALQHPVARIGLGPLGAVIFGITVGISQGKADWLSLLLLCVMCIGGQIVDHWFFLRYNEERHEVTQVEVLYLGEGLLLGSALIFMFQHHWAVNMILLTYLVFLHVQYFPYNLTYTVNHFILVVFFQSLVLNCVAYFSQAKGMTWQFLVALLPLTVLQVVIQAITFKLHARNMNFDVPSWLNWQPLVTQVMTGVALVLALILSLPSRSFFLVQLIFLAISGLGLVPLFLNVNSFNGRKQQINYLAVIYFIVTMLYGWSYVL